MTYLEALYGGQYYEIHQRGGDASKGRINGNVFLAALFVLLVIDIIIAGVALKAAFPSQLGSFAANWFNGMSGRTIGKLLAFVLMGSFYFIMMKTIGSEKNYNRLAEKFMHYPDEEKKKAKWKALIPFGILLVILIIGIFILK